MSTAMQRSSYPTTVIEMDIHDRVKTINDYER